MFSCYISDRDGNKVTTVLATAGQGSDRPQEVSYTDAKVIGNGSFGVVYQAKLVESNELVAIKKVLQDKRFKVSTYVQVWKLFERKVVIIFLPINLNICHWVLKTIVKLAHQMKNEMFWLRNKGNDLSPFIRFPPMWYVRPAKPHTHNLIRAFASRLSIL